MARDGCDTEDTLKAIEDWVNTGVVDMDDEGLRLVMV